MQTSGPRAMLARDSNAAETLNNQQAWGTHQMSPACLLIHPTDNGPLSEWPRSKAGSLAGAQWWGLILPRLILHH